MKAVFEYQFQPIKDLKKVGVAGELDKALEEIEEVMAELDKGNENAAAMEVMDTIHALESALRCFGFEHRWLNTIRNQVIKKNEARGYYPMCSKYKRICGNAELCERTAYECDFRYAEG